jgi:hypothetical protein
MSLIEQDAIPRIHHLIGLNRQGLEVVLPQRVSLGGVPHSAPYTGIKALMLAVLEEGILCYLGRDERARREATDWIASHGRRSPFAFSVLCETLGLEPSAVRIALRRLQGDTGASRTRGQRIRPNVSRSHPLTRRAGSTRSECLSK